MLLFRYGCALLIGCASLYAIAPARAQNPVGDERMRMCVSVLSRGLETGMSPDDYPDQARRDGRQGQAQVQLAVSFNGQMEQASLAQGSGDAELDQAALSAAQRIFPTRSRAPAQCRLGYGFTVTLAVIYKLLESQ